MASRLKKLRKAFGWRDALRMYGRIKWGSNRLLRSDFYGTSFRLRPGTSDYSTFEHIFLQNQYDIQLPITPETILDAGANIGLSAVYFSHRFPNASIVAVEPDQDNFRILQENVSNHHQIQTLRAGVWSQETHLKITDANTGKNAFMVTETEATDAFALPALSPLTIMQRYGWHTIDLLKIDIEGSEKELFEHGYEDWLPKTKIILVELHDFMKPGCSKSVFKAISQYNFSFALQDENLIFTNLDWVKPSLAK